jgi:hypothetical protein
MRQAVWAFQRLPSYRAKVAIGMFVVFSEAWEGDEVVALVLQHSGQ